MQGNELEGDLQNVEGGNCAAEMLPIGDVGGDVLLQRKSPRIDQLFLK